MTSAAALPSSAQKPTFIYAAWISLIVPLLTAGWVYYASTGTPAPTVLDSHAILTALIIVFALGFAAGCVSLFGVKANGALVIVPPALLGILINFSLEVLALIFRVLGNLPGP